MNRPVKHKAVVIGTSFGGLKVLKLLLAQIDGDFDLPILIAQHLSLESEGYWIEMLNRLSPLEVKEADEKEPIIAGKVYIAPPNYHLLVEPDHTLSLCVHERVNYARPSIDVLFESASHVYQQHLIGILLTGANKDGAEGLKQIKENNGFTIIQDPETAEADIMPLAGLACVKPDLILTPQQVSSFLNQLKLTNLSDEYKN